MLIDVRLDTTASILREVHASLTKEYPKAILSVVKLPKGDDPVLFVKPARLTKDIRKIVKTALKDADAESVRTNTNK